jgi:hypothetical protein
LNGASKNAVSSVSSLVKKALRRDEVERRFDIVSNQASAELRAIGPAALPAIESVLLSEFGDVNAASDRARQMPGLMDVLVVFFDIARWHNTGLAANLLRSLPAHLQVYALSAIWSIWIGRSKQGPIPEDLLRVIRELANSATAEPREKSNALLTAYTLLGPRRGHAPA